MFLSFPLAASAQQPCALLGYPIQPDPSTLQTANCTSAGSVTVPQGAKFVILEASEEVYSPPDEDGSVTLTLSAPGRRLLYWHDSVAGGAPGSQGGPPWTGGWVSFGEGGAFIYHRDLVWVIDVSGLTQQGDIQLELRTDGDLGFSCSINLYGDASVTLTQTPKSFRPEDARDDPATSGCSRSPGDNCRPSFKAQSNLPGTGNCSDIGIKYDFTLDHPSAIAGQPVTSWLKGSSSNGGTDDVSVPDYIFKPQNDAQLGAPDRGGLHVATVASFDGSDLTLVVTSHDYGGSAVLRPKATITGSCIVGGSVTVGFNVLDEKSEDVQAPKCADTAQFVKRPFASLPVDQDCNGIADDWENNHGGPFPDPKADADPGALGSGTPDAYKGDGFAVFDEYRGFHMLDAWANTVWHDTDPRVQDLFYWDPNGLIQQSPLDPSPNRLANIFGVQTGGFIALHEVNAKQAHGDPNDATAPLDPLNSNSPFLVSFGPQAFAVVYVKGNLNQPQDAGALGQSCNIRTNGQSPTYPSCYRNDGQEPIHIDSNRIDRLARKFWKGDPTAYESVLLDDVLAHETGHKLGLWHHTRTAARIALDKEQVKNLPNDLPFGNFIQSKDRTQVTVEEYLYMLLKANGFKHDTLRIDEVPGCTTGAAFDVRGQTPFPGNVRLPYWPIEGIVVDVSPAPPLSLITLDSQDGEIMSSKPELDHTADDDWQFGGDLGGMCLQPAGCGKALPSVNCGE